jgi:hypothetical protein
MKKTLLAVMAMGVVLGFGLQPVSAQETTIRDLIKDVLQDPATRDILNPVLPPEETPKSSYPAGTLTRAMNLARQAAEQHNGGLNYYRAEQSMYGPAIESPYKDNGDGTLTFTFLGGAPAAPPTLQSEVTVDVSNDLVSVDYNGPVRSAEN